MTDLLNWDLQAMYQSDDLLQEDIDLVKKELEKVVEISKNPLENIDKILRAYESISRKISNIYSYAHMKKDEDSRVSKYQKMNMEIQTVYTDFETKFSFLTPFLLGLDDETFNEIKNRQDLKTYELTLDKIFRFKPYTLSQDQEKIVSALSPVSQAPSEIYYYLTNADMTFPKLESTEEKLSQQTFVKLQYSEDRKIRKEAFEKFYDTFSSFGNTIASSYYSNVKGLCLEANLRGYDSARQMELYRDDVDVKVYDALIESIHKNMPAIHKYFEIKKRALKLDEQHMYDVYMPITSSFDREYTFEEAKDLVIASVEVMGKEYQDIYKKAFEERWIDVYPRDGKRGGAYSSGSYDSNPYILLNFNGTLDSVFTLAHEMGHSMHSYYAKKNNSYLEHGYTIFAAEVASTFNEALLLNYLMDRLESDQEKLYLVDFYLNSFKSTVFRQTMFAEFERETHRLVEEGNGLTSEDFSSIYLDLNKKYFGPAMVSDERIGYEWMRIPHFYSNFYVYKYATGFTASTILANRVLNKEEGALENYFKFLKDGNKHFPIDQLKMAGVDMTDPTTVDEALEVFKKQVEELDKLI
ncbi:MAG: oligoendopeptidase F [Tissierellia bacterium]|nr:oligoendopeptidase F [Tissierellia bacterium]